MYCKDFSQSKDKFIRKATPLLKIVLKKTFEVRQMERRLLRVQLRQAFRIALDNIRLHDNRPQAEGLTPGEILRVMVSVVLQAYEFSITGRVEYINTLNSNWSRENRSIWASNLEFPPAQDNQNQRRNDDPPPPPPPAIDGDENDPGDYRRRLVVSMEVSTRFSTAFLTIVNINSRNGCTRPINFSSLRIDNPEENDFTILTNIRSMIDDVSSASLNESPQRSPDTTQ